MKEDRIKTIIEFRDELINRAEGGKGRIYDAIQEYDKNMFISGMSVEINEVPLSSFQLLADGHDVKVKFYDVSEGTQCLQVWFRSNDLDVIFNSVEIQESKDE